VRLCIEAIRQGGTAPAALNAANEIAVEAFLGGRLGFTQIPQIIEKVLGEVDTEPLNSLEQAYAADVEARALASRFISRLTHSALVS
jgi:1-deoxy-D-xylulose-5-phosphate reductoisomerase